MRSQNQNAGGGMENIIAKCNKIRNIENIFLTLSLYLFFKFYRKWLTENREFMYSINCTLFYILETDLYFKYF